MDVGIGLPNAVPDTEGRTLVDWARRADEAGFSTLGTIGRLVYPNYEELIALAAAAAVTSRIRLTTSVLLAPLHTNTALFAKQAASLDRISGGRLVLGLGIGGREDDFAASGLTMAGRACLPATRGYGMPPAPRHGSSAPAVAFMTVSLSVRALIRDASATGSTEFSTSQGRASATGICLRYR